MSIVTHPPARGTGHWGDHPPPEGASPAARRSALRRRDRDRRQPGAAGPDLEPRGERLRRGGRRTALYVAAAAVVGLLAVLIALIVANTGSVPLNWVVGSGEASLVWIIFFTGLAAWLLGIATSSLFRHRTRWRAAAHRARRDARDEEPAR